MHLTNGDVVVIVDGNEVAQLQVTSHGGGLTGNTLHGAAIAEEGVGVVVQELVAGLVEDTSGVSLGNGQTDGVGETLAEGTGGDLDTGGVVSLGVTGSDAVELLGRNQRCGSPPSPGARLTRKAFRSSMVSW